MSSAIRLLPNYTHADYIRWEGRWEIIDGIPYAMSPMPSLRHQKTANDLGALLRKTINESDTCNCNVYQPIDIKIRDNTVVNADLIILCHEVNGQVVDSPPALVVEILSPSTQLKDRHTKFNLYQEFKIPYYLIVDIDSKSVEVYSNKDKGYIQQDEDQKIELCENCSVQFNFNSIW